MAETGTEWRRARDDAGMSADLHLARSAPLMRCNRCHNAMWWDVTSGQQPSWYCSVCAHPPERTVNAAAVPAPCPRGCRSPITEHRGGERRFICH